MSRKVSTNPLKILNDRVMYFQFSNYYPLWYEKCIWDLMSDSQLQIIFFSNQTLGPIEEGERDGQFIPEKNSSTTTQLLSRCPITD